MARDLPTLFRIGPLNLPMSAHFPVTIARPMSVTWVITPVCEEWKIRRSEGAIHESDIERCRHGMVSDIRRIVAGTAKTVDGLSVQDVVEPGDSRDRDF